jgi:hypothetical protein
MAASDMPYITFWTVYADNKGHEQEFGFLSGRGMRVGKQGRLGIDIPCERVGIADSQRGPEETPITEHENLRESSGEKKCHEVTFLNQILLLTPFVFIDCPKSLRCHDDHSSFE